MNKAKLQIIKSRIASSGYFDEDYYAAQFEKRPAGDLLEYYILHGAEEDKDPSALFDNAYSVSQYEDVKSAGINPLYHYILHGRAEGRQAKKEEMRRISPEELREMRKVISNSGLFSEEYYASQFDERPAGDLLDRYIMYGAYEDKDPSTFFDNSYYLGHNKDIKEARLNPLYHYITHGKAEGRLPAEPAQKEKKEPDLYSEWVRRRKAQKGPMLSLHELHDLYVIAKSGMFDGAWYLEQNPDVYDKLARSAAWKWRFSNNKIKRTVGRFFSTAIRHYIKNGMYEGKDPNQDFSTAYYINHNPDLMAGRYITPFAHYIQHGRAENRRGRDDSAVNFPWKNMIPLNTFADKKPTLSVITVNGAAYSGDALEVIAADGGIKDAIARAKGDVIWITDGRTLPGDALDMFSMEMVYAVVCDGKLLKNREKTALCSYRDLGSKKHIIKGEVYGYSDILLRNPAKFSCFEETEEISSEEDYMLLMLRSVRGGAVGIVHGGSRRTSEDAGYYEGLAEILFRWYIDEPKKKAAFSDFRKAVVSSGVTDYTGFAEMFDAEKILRRSMNIMIGIYAFTFGGGEIMPIRLANALYRMGHNVTVHILLKNERDDKVRAMLSPEVPVVYGESKAAIAMYIADFGVQVYNSHHQAIQQRAAEALDAYPFIAKKILNIGTSHGMYENLARDSADYLFRESALMKVTDRWTYVANKNIKPFEEYNVYDPKIFKKIPNGMVRPETSPVDMAQFGITGDSFTVCIVSRAKKEKGWLNAVNAVEKAREKTGRDIHLLLVGDGEVYDEYSKK
ncbi:MAG: hypothetical protein ILP19_02555, partial [Oscillospiraceae bacterium]|nr:hypothetical protein [Oscillospiraceae bacterium]